MAPIPDLSYESLRARCGPCIHPARSAAQADLYELDWERRPALLKDFTGRPWWVRWFWSKAIVAREVRILRALDDMQGVPHVLATAGPDAYVMERLPGDRIPNRSAQQPPDVFWDHARERIKELHRRGVAHGDLRRKNILVDPEGNAYLIDFATAVRLKRNGFDAWLARRIFKRMCRIDCVKFARMKAEHLPGQLTPEEQAWLNNSPWYLGLGQFFKKRIYRLRKRHHRERLFKSIRRWLQGKPAKRSR